MSNHGMRREIWDKDRIKLRALLKEARVNADLTQIELAEKLETTQASISKYESGERTLEFVEVLKICKVCKCSVDQIINKLEL